MFAYIVKRLIAGFVVLILVSISIFLLFWYGPNEPARVMCDTKTNNRCNAERLDRFTKELGYDNFWAEEYGKYVKGVFVGREYTIAGQQFDCDAPCFGLSYKTSKPVWDDMKERLPATFSVAIGGATLYLLLGVPLGVAAARRRGTVQDKMLVSSFLVLSSVPYYLFALLTFLYAAVFFQIPVLGNPGYVPFTESPYQWFTGLALAWICLGIFGCTQYTRYARGAMVEALGEDYVRTAKAKGLSRRNVVFKHAFRNALIPLVTVMAVDIGLLFGGLVVTEQIFSIPGMGRLFISSLFQGDVAVLVPWMVVTATFVILFNLLADLLYSVLDPRIRHS